MFKSYVLDISGVFLLSLGMAVSTFCYQGIHIVLHLLEAG